jgi:hypothetical protein
VRREVVDRRPKPASDHPETKDEERRSRDADDHVEPKGEIIDQPAIDVILKLTTALGDSSADWKPAA